MKLRRIRPSRISRDATNRAVRLAMAKHRPCAAAMTAVLMPITSPSVVTSGPPELPGLSAASVWTISSMIAAGSRSKRSAERADDARGHGVLKAVRVADGDRDLTDANATASRQG